MPALAVTLDPAEVDRRSELAQREGASIEDIAAAAVRARPDEEAAWRAEVEGGLAELDAGAGMTLEDFEREMDAFVAELKQYRDGPKGIVLERGS